MLLLTAALAITVLASLAAVSIALSALSNNKKVIDTQTSTENSTNIEVSTSSPVDSSEPGQSKTTSVRTEESTYDWESMLGLTPSSREAVGVPGCGGDEVGFGGKCEELATRGPCKEGEWLLLLGFTEGAP